MPEAPCSSSLSCCVKTGQYGHKSEQVKTRTVKIASGVLAQHGSPPQEERNLVFLASVSSEVSSASEDVCQKRCVP